MSNRKWNELDDLIEEMEEAARAEMRKGGVGVSIGVPVLYYARRLKEYREAEKRRSGEKFAVFEGRATWRVFDRDSFVVHAVDSRMTRMNQVPEREESVTAYCGTTRPKRFVVADKTGRRQCQRCVKKLVARDQAK